MEILITTRQWTPDLQGIRFSSMEVGEMDEIEAMNMFLKSSNLNLDKMPDSQRKAAKEIVHRLGSLPLALLMVGSVISQRDRICQ